MPGESLCTRTAGLLIVLAVAVGCGARAGMPEDLYIYPYLQNVTDTGITVMWETTEPVEGIVEYGQGGKFGKRVKEKVPAKIHEVRLEGLKPGERYEYRVRYGKVMLEPSTFSTAPGRETRRWRFVVYGDNRTYPDRHARIATRIREAAPAIVLNTGDLVSDGRVYEQWKAQFFDPFRGLADRVPVFVSIGTHERNAKHYYAYVDVPDENGESYYSFDYANAHFIALNSNAKDAPFERGGAQTEWLIRDLEAHRDAEWKIVFFHHPLFRCMPTRGVEPQRWVWQPIFEEYGVDLVLNGHDHYYARSYPIGRYTGDPRRGVRHIVSGGGGAPNYPTTPRVYIAARKSAHHVLVLDVDGDRILGRAVDIEGEVFDAFVIDKRASLSPEEFVAYEVFEFERALRDAIHAMTPLEATKNGVAAEVVLSVPTPFSVPARAELTWEGATGWTVEPPRMRFDLAPGDTLALRVRVSASDGSVYPVPRAVLRFTGPEGEMLFRNDTVSFHPLKVHPDLEVTSPTDR